MKTSMTGKERLTRVFQGKAVDRPSLKLWGLSIDQPMLAPAYKPVYDLGLELTDIVEQARSPFNILFGSSNEHLMSYEDKPITGSHWIDRYEYIKLPDRTLRSIKRYSSIGEPGYTMEYMLKSSSDIKALLKLPYENYSIDLGTYQAKLNKVGNRGIVYYSLDHGAYALIRNMGSELFGLMTIDDRDLLKEAILIFRNRILEQTKAVLSMGAIPFFGWVGPELCIPPLAGMNDFKDFVFDMDKEICDTIHNGGGYVWLHCHGSVKKLLKPFVDMGVDVLNPIEPPPQGNVTLTEAIEIVGDKMGLEGNIEISSLLLSQSEEDVKKIVYEAVLEGKKSSRFILCPSTSYMEYPRPSEQFIKNLLAYLEYGYKYLNTL